MFLFLKQKASDLKVSFFLESTKNKNLNKQLPTKEKVGI